MLAFYYNPGEQMPALVGVLGPSHDRVGRTYPFLVAGEVGGFDVVVKSPAHADPSPERPAP